MNEQKYRSTNKSARHIISMSILYPHLWLYSVCISKVEVSFVSCMQVYVLKYLIVKTTISVALYQ